MWGYLMQLLLGILRCLQAALRLSVLLLQPGMLHTERAQLPLHRIGGLPVLPLLLSSSSLQLGHLSMSQSQLLLGCLQLCCAGPLSAGARLCRSRLSSTGGPFCTVIAVGSSMVSRGLLSAWGGGRSAASGMGSR